LNFVNILGLVAEVPPKNYFTALQITSTGEMISLVH